MEHPITIALAHSPLSATITAVRSSSAYKHKYAHLLCGCVVHLNDMCGGGGGGEGISCSPEGR
jgi:hypothetical protein